MPYPAVLLGVPLGAEGVERLAPLGAVGELEEAGEGAPVVGRVGEDGVLEVDAVGQDVIVLIHPAEETNRKTVRGKPKLLQELLSCRVAEVLDVHESNQIRLWKFHRLMHFMGWKCIICNEPVVCFAGKTFLC